MADKVQVQADEFAKNVKKVNNRLKNANGALADMRRQLAEQAILNDVARAKELSTKLITGLQDARTLSGALNAALTGGLDSRIAALSRSQEDLQLFTSIDASRDGVFNAARDYANGMNTFMSDLGTLGIQVPEDAKKGGALASTAISLAGNLATGNYVGAVFGAMGALGIGGGGNDSGQQVLGGINQILEGQKIIMQKLDQVLQTQRQILTTLAELSNQIERNQQELF